MTTIDGVQAGSGTFGLEDPRLAPLREKVERGERLSIGDGELLYETPDVWGVFELAERVRRRMHGDAAYYNINKHLNYSNVCALSCTFCEFARKRGEEGAYEFTIEEIVETARGAIEAGATEMHIVGGLHPYHPFEFYTEMLRALKRATPRLHLKGFTAVEIVHLSKIAKRHSRKDPAAGIRWVLEQLKEAGLDSMPGGGAEVFDDRVHDEAFKGKIRSDVWLTVHREAHGLGLNTNATILYGHVEGRRERLVHMDMLRTAQDEALVRLGYEADGEGFVTLSGEGAELPTPKLNERGGYFQTITPLPFFPDGSALEALPGPTGLENLRTLAIARLMLDNFPHVKAFWIMQTLAMAELELRAGADDIDGTVVWYDITKLAGPTTHQETSVFDLERAVREAGFTPVERDTLYRRVEREGREWRVVG